MVPDARVSKDTEYCLLKIDFDIPPKWNTVIKIRCTIVEIRRSPLQIFINLVNYIDNLVITFHPPQCGIPFL